jgi:GMP synthase-like glutamine amidotransferase
MRLIVLDLHRRDVTEALKITNQLDKYTKTTLLRVFSPDFSYDTLNGYDGIILSGSDDRSVYYDPKVRQLAAPLKNLSSEGIHVLGICGGNQVLARTYGYRRYRLPEPEVAWNPITLTDRGRSDPLFAGLEDRFLAFERHVLAVRCDDRDRILAENDQCVQAILYQPTVRGIQFHPEAPLERERDRVPKPKRDSDRSHTFQVPEQYRARAIFPNFVKMIT